MRVSVRARVGYAQSTCLRSKLRATQGERPRSPQESIFCHRKSKAEGRVLSEQGTLNLQIARSLYEEIRKYEATALFLVRTEVIGLNAWLTAVGVPDILSRCGCGWPAQIVRHVFVFCPDLTHQRQLFFQRAGTDSLDEMLQSSTGSRAAARFFIDSQLLEQFRLASDIYQEPTAEYRELSKLHQWGQG